MIRCEGNTLVVQGAVTVNNVTALTQEGIALLDHEYMLVDLQQVIEVDSTVISMLFEWLREANKKNCHLEFIRLPASIESLVQLYGVNDIITPLSNPSKPES
ncbi:phospholipid transport system transporter-binding protein [Nitrosomonas aestuarii]|uniref:Phospholipid transport system transporter-binding protein n=1 Tax=Nitrosomonas aestuarii TaxID=52441 RepID=A0A1I3ZSC4_9PROT|nr:STAS domain-containing protein [Nitrosomonas aestuarii]SFK46576.1 phospholipid transport system transporter-binding protein [Nitrosomonas aestuarii]